MYKIDSGKLLYDTGSSAWGSVRGKMGVGRDAQTYLDLVQSLTWVD